ncbi:hypothetical protein HK101_000484 [Irineochytrium annulatum]|nr:hypothetical protein HK101_000484 [Irineochytrium annulatum]
MAERGRGAGYSGVGAEDSDEEYHSGPPRVGPRSVRSESRDQIRQAIRGSRRVTGSDAAFAAVPTDHPGSPSVGTRSRGASQNVLDVRPAHGLPDIIATRSENGLMIVQTELSPVVSVATTKGGKDVTRKTSSPTSPTMENPQLKAHRVSSPILKGGKDDGDHIRADGKPMKRSTQSQQHIAQMCSPTSRSKLNSQSKPDLAVEVRSDMQLPPFQKRSSLKAQRSFEAEKGLMVEDNPFATPTSATAGDPGYVNPFASPENPDAPPRPRRSRSRVSISESPTIIGEFNAPSDAPPVPILRPGDDPLVNAHVNPLFASTVVDMESGFKEPVIKTNSVGPGAASIMASQNNIDGGPPKVRKRPQKKGAGPRRMSLGAALCIPPPPRIDNKMNPMKFLKLSLGALGIAILRLFGIFSRIIASGIVYGDIGVSPLFVLKTVFASAASSVVVMQPDGIEAYVDYIDPNIINEDKVLGTLSFLIWVITIVCVLKYIMFVLTADKNGEGGTWALVSLLPMENEESRLYKYKKQIFVLGIIAASFLLADGFIAPAISVLSAFEGVQQYSSNLPDWGVIGISSFVLIIIFVSQQFGTSRMLKFYGPIMVTWFLAIAGIGLYNITYWPTIFWALSPHCAVRLVWIDFNFTCKVASQVVLAVTGVEAMYADLGHFKTIPIRASFLFIVYPALLLNYLGQGAYLLHNPEAANHPFFYAVPSPVKWIILVLATLAAIIASQATISGCFTLIDQAISLRVFPNIKAIHTSSESAGAVYIPAFNYLLMIVSVSLILIFQESDRLANIYDLTLLLSSVTKVQSYGWVSILLGLMLFATMYSWYITTTEIQDGLREKLLEMSDLRQQVKSINRTKGTVVFVSNTDEDVPNVLRICAEQLRSLPENIVCMSAISSTAPFIADEERTVFRTIDAVAGIYRLVISYGYAERTIDTVTAVERSRKRGLRMKPDERVTFVVGREIVASHSGTPWIKRLRIAVYSSIGANTEGKIEYYNLPPRDTLEIGSQMVLETLYDEDEEEYEA